MNIRGLGRRYGVTTREKGWRDHFCGATPAFRRFSKRVVAKERRRNNRHEIEYGMVQEATDLRAFVFDHHDRYTRRGWLQLLWRDYFRNCRQNPCPRFDDNFEDDAEYEEELQVWEQNSRARRTLFSSPYRFDDYDDYDDPAVHAMGYDDYDVDFNDAYYTIDKDYLYKISEEAAQRDFLTGQLSPPRSPEDYESEDDYYDDVDYYAVMHLQALEAERYREDVVDLKELWKRNGLAV